MFRVISGSTDPILKIISPLERYITPESYKLISILLNI